MDQAKRKEFHSGSIRPRSAPKSRVSTAEPSPLVLDLDGTLLKTDLLVEGIIALIRRNILMVLPVLLWLIQGKAVLKRKVAERAGLDVATLPFNREVIAFAEAEKARGRLIVLATAADELLAYRIAQHLPFIDRVIASDGRTNLKGEAKAARLSQLYPEGFTYAGDCAADLLVWRAADHLVLVGVSPAVRRAAEGIGRPITVFERGSAFRALVRGLRLHQWAKNLLIFLPLVLGGKAQQPEAWIASGLAFLALGLIASATYLVNDLWDLPHDRAHWSKSARPLASGDLSIPVALVALALGLVGGFTLAASLGLPALLAVSVYAAVTLAYSISLKRIPILDAATLGGLFTLRLVLGIAAVGVVWSPWLLTFSMFLFTSLSFAKRQVEMRGAVRAGKTGRIAGRGYESADEPIVTMFGIAAGVASVVIFILYLSNEAFRNASLAAPLLLWVFPPVLMLWIGRIWILAGRDALNDDPVAFAIKDRPSLTLGGIAGLAFLLAATGLPAGLLT